MPKTPKTESAMRPSATSTRIRPNDPISLRDDARARAAFSALSPNAQAELGKTGAYGRLDCFVVSPTKGRPTMLSDDDRQRWVRLGLLAQKDGKIIVPKGTRLILKYLPPPPHKGGVLQLG